MDTRAQGESFEPLDDETVRRLMDVARDFSTRAYVPYSGFPVGAAVLTADGSIIGGVNIENASYPLTVCGERTAIGTAAAMGHRDILAVAVYAPKAKGTTPCGGCRQVMNEFKPREGDLIVLVEEEAGPHQIPLRMLLPAAFGPRDLDRAKAGNS